MTDLIFVKVASNTSVEEVERLRDELNRLPYAFVIMSDNYDVMSRDEVMRRIDNLHDSLTTMPGNSDPLTF
jgi:hypothetical protein